MSYMARLDEDFRSRGKKYAKKYDLEEGQEGPYEV